MPSASSRTPSTDVPSFREALCARRWRGASGQRSAAGAQETDERGHAGAPARREGEELIASRFFCLRRSAIFFSIALGSFSTSIALSSARRTKQKQERPSRTSSGGWRTRQWKRHILQ